MLIHYPSLQAVEEKQIREALEDYFVLISSIKEQEKQMNKNFERIEQENFLECSSQKKIFYKQPLVIIGSGPSVDYELESIKMLRSRFKILAVGSIARKLFQNGITPDAIIMLDSQEHMYQQIKDLPTQEIPLFLLSTASENILDYYKGEIYVIYQKDYQRAEETARLKKYHLYQTGGSVATLALDLGIVFEASPIILVGVDMAYTENKSHASSIERIIPDMLGLREVVSTTGQKIYTSKTLDVCRKWIEKRIEKEKGLIIYNTSHGARISGTIEKSISEIFEQ